KGYDGTTSSAGAPTITTGTLAAGDTASWTQSFDTKNVGSSKTLTPAGTVADGNTGLNYTVTFVTSSTGSNKITARVLHVVAVGVNKTYDGTTVATVTLSDDRLSGDVFTASYSAATFADKN